MRLAAAVAVAFVATTHVSADAVSAVPVALTVSPARAELLAPSSRTLQLSNRGSERLAVDVAWRPLDLRIPPHGWLIVAPSRLVLRSGGRALLTVRAGSGASPGDHNLLVLLTGRPVDGGGRVAVRLRVGVRIRVRAPGRLLRKLALGGLRVQRFNAKRALVVAVANRGNVTEQLRGRLTVTLVDHNRVISQLRYGKARELYPDARTVVVLPYAGRAHGVMTAVVRIRLGARACPLERRYRLLL